MQLRDLDAFSGSEDWDRKWVGIFDHYQNDLRHAFYIHAMLESEEQHLLEIGAGSFRDMAELRRRGLNCEGMDFSLEAVVRAKEYFPEFAGSIHHMSAFSMPFADGAFDLTYHNGFWVLFSDEQIKGLAEEQARISKRRMIVTVHNAHNVRFVDYFDRKKVDDPLFDIRFFEKDEVIELMRPVCRDVLVVPVGKGKQYHEDLLIKNGIVDPHSIRDCLRANELNYMADSERLMCIGSLY